MWSCLHGPRSDRVFSGLQVSDSSRVRASCGPNSRSMSHNALAFSKAMIEAGDRGLPFEADCGLSFSLGGFMRTHLVWLARVSSRRMRQDILSYRFS